MDRTLFRTTAMVGLVFCMGMTAAEAGGHHGGMAAPFRPVYGMHGGWAHPGMGRHAGMRGMPPVSGVIRTQPTGYGAPAGYGYSHGPAVYSMQRPGYGMPRPGYGMQQPGYAMQRPGYPMQRPGYAMQRPAYGGQGGYATTGGYAYGGGRERVADLRYGGRYGLHRRGGYGYGGAAALGAVAGGVVGYTVGGAGYGDSGYGYGYGGDTSAYGVAAPADTGYPAPETPLTVRYGEPAVEASGTAGGLFGTGGYALDGQVQDVGYGGPTVPGYGFGGTTGWAPGIAPAGGLAVYSPGAYGPGPRVITIPSQYRTGGCTCGTPTPGY